MPCAAIFPSNLYAGACTCRTASLFTTGVFLIYSRLAVHPLLSASQNLLERARNLTRPGTPGLGQTQYFTKCNFHGTYWNLFEHLRNLQRMEAKQNIGFSEHTGTCWNLLGTCLVLGTRPWPNATFPNCNSHGTHWNLLEPLWNLQPAWAKLDFSFSEPTGTCPEYIRFWAPGLSQTQLSRK